MKNFYIISQNKSYKAEVDGGFIWCPQKNKNGANNEYYNYVSGIKKGDVIFSRYKNLIPTIGVASSDCYLSNNPFNHDTWNLEGYRVDINYVQTGCKKRCIDYFEEYMHFLPEKYSPLNKDGKSIEAYAFQISKDFADYLINTFLEIKESDLDYLFFTEDNLDYLNEKDEIKIKTYIKENSKSTSSSYVVNVEKESQQLLLNKELGNAGELFVLKLLRDELGDLNDEIKNSLVIHASNDKAYGADSAGFDIITFSENTKEVCRYIEVKTTTGDFDKPFYISPNELRIARKYPDQYYIYRVYNFLSDPKVEFFPFSKIPQSNIIPAKYKVHL